MQAARGIPSRLLGLLHVRGQHSKYQNRRLHWQLPVHGDDLSRGAQIETLYLDVGVLKGYMRETASVKHDADGLRVGSNVKIRRRSATELNSSTAVGEYTHEQTNILH